MYEILPDAFRMAVCASVWQRLVRRKSAGSFGDRDRANRVHFLFELLESSGLPLVMVSGVAGLRACKKWNIPENGGQGRPPLQNSLDLQTEVPKASLRSAIKQENQEQQK
jgi:hypothetical protein